MELTAGERIRNARKTAGLTQQQLATKYGIPIRTLSDWERLKFAPPDYVLNLLLDRIAIDHPPKEDK